MGKNIVLTGFMAVGKSTISKELSKISKMIAVDTDVLIEEEESRCISDIFAQDGEEYFRNAETAMCEKLSKSENMIIATGGGIVLREKNMELLRKNGIIFLLDADFLVIKKRLERNRAARPLAALDDFDGIKKRFEFRKPYYDNCDFRIKVSDECSPSDVAQEIMSIYLKEQNI